MPVGSSVGSLRGPQIFAYKNWFDEFQNEAAKTLGDSEINREEDAVVSNRSGNQLVVRTNRNDMQSTRKPPELETSQPQPTRAAT